MKNNKISLLPGLSLFLCFCLLTGTGKLAGHFGGGAPLLALAEFISFALPFALVVYSMRDQKALRRYLKPRKLPKGAIGLTVKIGLTVAVLSLFLNLLIYQLAGLAGADLSATALDAPQTGIGFLARLAVIVGLSAVVEEFYLRGALLTVHEGCVGTSACLLFSGLAFAMLHGSLMNFAGPLLAGIAYAYLTYVFGSVWPAVLAHAVNNLYYMFVLWITDTYAAFGIWNYFAAINGLALLLFLYLSLRALESMLVKGAIPHFEKSAGLYDLWLLVRNPGVAAFVLAFAAKLVLDWIG
ncbi:MAG TPA: CPBP family intramembrane metalloprotease [Candidatus Agathobaculum stercoravium]|mgnify:CR=1 FL=1|nr:type II CAAX endopeptidase family protein [uncultured Agathobaculum sp.]HIV97222.1 CPBP family intramembrane metalloprotease [Candidatus Agathobaculum stercoravium]